MCNKVNKRTNPFYKIVRNEVFLRPLDFPVNEFPFYVDVELTNDCNIDCIMCKRQIMTREIGYMPEDVYRRIIDEMSMYNAGIRFCRSGEPTLHKQIIQFIEIAKENNVVNYLSTNGYYSRDKAQRILESMPDIIRFSFQGLGADDFEKFRRPSKYDNVKDNIIYCSEERDIRGWDKPYLIISTTVLDESQRKIESFKKEWLKLVDRVEVGKTIFSWVKHEGRYEEEKSRVTIEKKYFPCLELMTKISINWNGDITACCGDYNGHMVLGNIRDMSIKEAWNSDKEIHYRKMLAYSVRHAEFPLCKDCFKGEYKFKDNPVK